MNVDGTVDAPGVDARRRSTHTLACARRGVWGAHALLRTHVRYYFAVVLKREIRPTRNFNLHSDNDAAGWHGCFLFRVVLLAPRGFLQRYKKRE